MKIPLLQSNDLILIQSTGSKPEDAIVGKWGKEIVMQGTPSGLADQLSSLEDLLRAQPEDSLCTLKLTVMKALP